eukprot:scaffold120291_cov27-Phaeocystis_antarctica.AAC.1
MRARRAVRPKPLSNTPLHATPMHAGCSPMQPGCNPMHRAATPMYPGLANPLSKLDNMQPAGPKSSQAA